MKISKEVKVGFFAFVGLIIFVMGYNFMKGFNFFKTYARYYVVYQNTGGVIKSTQVLINGFKVGQVEDVTFLNQGDASRLLVTLVMEADVKLPTGTIAEIGSSDLLGTKVIQLRLGHETNYCLPKDTLTGTMEQGLTETIQKMVSPIQEKSEAVLATLDKVLNGLNEVFDSNGTRSLSRGVKDLTETLNHVNHISARMDRITQQQEARINEMFVHTESILRNLKNNNEFLTKAIQNVAQITDSIAASNLTQTMKHLEHALAEFDVMIGKVNKGEGTLGQLANNDELYVNLNKSSKELSLLLADMQKYPGRYVHVSVFGGSKRASKSDKAREADLKTTPAQ